jgi:hypothetical protein
MKKTLDLNDVIIGQKYWVVNGHWEFTVKEINEIEVIVYSPYLSKKLTLKKTDSFTLEKR